MPKLLIAGDIFPNDDNIKLFESGDVETLFGDKIISLFKHSDSSIINLEGALTDSNQPQIKVGPVLKSSPKSCNGLKALGVTAVSLANNHVTDYLKQGVADTIDTLENNKIDHIGASIVPDITDEYKSITIGNISICIYCVSEVFFNSPFVNIYDEYLVCKNISRLKQQHDYLVVLYHGGCENYPYPTPSLRERFHRMADNGADFITAQHTHCIGCEESYNGSRLLYGQGNFLFTRQSKPINREGLICELDFDCDKMNVIYHMVEVKSDGTVCLADSQNLDGFKSRSKEILQEDFVFTKFKDYNTNRPILKKRYLRAFRGSSLEDKLFSCLSKQKYEQSLEHNYHKEHLIRIIFAMESDRMREDVLYMLKNLYEKCENN